VSFWGDSKCIPNRLTFDDSSPLLSRKEAIKRVDRVLNVLGLQGCMNQRIGTPIARGISGGKLLMDPCCYWIF
jgi:hypothetical protein